MACLIVEWDSDKIMWLEFVGIMLVSGDSLVVQAENWLLKVTSRNWRGCSSEYIYNYCLLA